jgi:hypothetical protein
LSKGNLLLINKTHFMEHTKPSRSKKKRIPSVSFELPVNGRSYAVSATPFTVPGGDIFYRVSYNDGPVHVFGWDEGLNRFADTDNLADVIPPVIEMGIAEKIQEVAEQLQHAA